MKLKLVTASPVGGWTKTKLMLISTQDEVVVKVKVELGKNRLTLSKIIRVMPRL